MNIHKIIQKAFHTSDRLDRDNMPVYLRRGTRVTLAECFRTFNFNIGAEIGTRKGEYAMALCKANPDLHLYCVDPWMAYSHIRQDVQDVMYDVAMKNLEPYRITVIRKTSMDALADFADHSLDFVFIDGNHTFDFVCPDIIFWSYKVKHGGIIAAHDYMPGTWHGVMQAINSYTHCHDIRPWYTTRERESTAFWVNP